MGHRTVNTTHAWDTPYETGISFIDRQHRELFDILRRLRPSRTSAASHRELSTVLAALERAVPQHFLDEEAYMSRVRYPGQLDHCVEHRVFLIRLQNLRESHESGEPGAQLEATQFLCTWFREHILEQDSALAHHARALSHA